MKLPLYDWNEAAPLCSHASTHQETQTSCKPHFGERERERERDRERERKRKKESERERARAREREREREAERERGWTHLTAKKRTVADQQSCRSFLVPCISYFRYQISLITYQISDAISHSLVPSTLYQISDFRSHLSHIRLSVTLLVPSTFYEI